MSFNETGIRWTDYTYNPVHGCSKSGSPGCANCYAEKSSLRFGHTEEPWTPANAAENVTIKPDYLSDKLPGPRWCFVNSMSDLFHELVPPAFVGDVLGVCSVMGDSAFQVLTKHATDDRVCKDCGSIYAFGTQQCRECEKPLTTRSQAIAGGFADPETYDPTMARDVPTMPRNVMLGVSVGHPAWQYRLDWLRECDANVKFVSFEPLVECIPDPDLSGIDWAIIGGESGGGEQRRYMDPAWARNLVRSCWRQDVAVFFKQHSGPYPEERVTIDMGGGQGLQRIEEFPEMPDGVVPAPVEFLAGRVGGQPADD